MSQDLLGSGRPSTSVREEEEKEKEKEEPVSSESSARSVAHSSPLCLLGGAASGASAESSRAPAAQAASCNMRHSSFRRDALKCTNLGDTSLSVCLLSRAPTPLRFFVPSEPQVCAHVCVLCVMSQPDS